MLGTINQQSFSQNILSQNVLDANGVDIENFLNTITTSYGPPNFISQLYNGQKTWYINPAIIQATNINFDKIVGNAQGIFIFDSSFLPTIQRYLTNEYIQDNTISINKLYNQYNYTPNKYFLFSNSFGWSQKVLSLADVGDVSLILQNINTLTQSPPSVTSYIKIDNLNNTTYQAVFIPNALILALNTQTQITLNQINFTNNLLYYIYNNNQTLPPNDNDILVYQSSSSQFRHQSQSTLSIDHSQIIGLIGLNQIQNQNNGQRNYFTSTSGTNQYENLTHLNQFIALGYQNNYYLQSTSNGYQWTQLNIPTLNALLTALNSQTVVNINQIQSNTSGNLTFFKSQSGTNSFSQLVISDISNLNAVLLSINTLGYIPITYLAGANISSDQYLMISQSNTQSWNLKSSITWPWSQITSVPGYLSGQYIQNLGVLSLPSSNSFLLSDNLGSLFWVQLSTQPIYWSQLQNIPPNITNFAALGAPPSNRVLQSTSAGVLSWIPSLTVPTTANCIYYNNSSSIQSNLTGTNAFVFFNSSSQVSTLTTSSAGFPTFGPGGGSIGVTNFSTTYNPPPQCLDRDGSWSPYVTQLNIPSQYQYFAVNRIYRNVIGNYILGLDMFPDITTSTVYKSSLYYSRNDGGNGTPPVNDANTAFIGFILGSSAVNLFLMYTNGGTQNNIFGPTNSTILTLRMYLQSGTWGWVTPCSKDIKKEIKNNDDLEIKHNLCEKLLNTRLNIYEPKDGCVSGRCKKNINRRKPKIIGPYIEDLLTDELFYHCVSHVEDMEKDGTIEKQEINQDGYKMRHGIDFNLVTMQLINICREQSKRIIDLEQKVQQLEKTILNIDEMITFKINQKLNQQ